MALVFLTGMLLMTCICEGALIRKSSASDFLQTKRERRDAECYFGDCSRESSEVEEALNTGPDYEETDLSYEGDMEQNANEDTSYVLHDGAGEQRTAENEETSDAPDSGTAAQGNGQIQALVDAGDVSMDRPLQKETGPDGQKLHHDELGAVDGSGM